MKIKKQKMLEESKMKVSDIQQEEEEEALVYPEECRVLDIMRDKYYEAISFFNDTDKKQLPTAIKEYQRFRTFYNKMSEHLEFNPCRIEDDIYERLSDDHKILLANREIIKEINFLRIRKAGKILEDSDVNVLNF
jgi:hypothetical protein